MKAKDLDAVKALLADGPFLKMMPQASADVLEMMPIKQSHQETCYSETSRRDKATRVFKQRS